MLIHAKLGCDTIVLDYVSSLKLQKIIINFVYFITVVCLFLVILATLKLKYFL